MVVDTSALIAIFWGEPDGDAYLVALSGAPIKLLSAANLLEMTMVVGGIKAKEASVDLDQFIYRSGIEIVPVSLEQAEAARAAWRGFGKGNHPASLNYGDCFAYALAKVTGEPLLFKGVDFSRTDIEAALPL